ncbi:MULTISPECIES: hypothetical protein [Streptomyces]|uniref:Membrane protein n=1 Tax=Streptomyces luteosporeus TaxID=173856 RepID=A0ABN3TJE9_9ACTN
MGIESDQLVYDYLSKVGDLAQRQSLTSADRMRLVSRLRTEIERRRAAEGAETPTAVQRILDGLGTPSEAVAGADGLLAGDGPGVPVAPVAPAAPDAGRVPEQRREALPPHLAPEEQLRPAGGRREADWWRVERIEPVPLGGGGDAARGAAEAGGDAVYGFTGGIEIADMLRPPPPRLPEPQVPAAAKTAEAADAQPAGPAGPGPEGEAAADEPRFSLWRSRAGVPMSPLLLLVAVLLVAGAVLGNWLVLVAGWALAYVTRRLTQTESKWAVLGVPGLVAAAGVVWLWGRANGRWGEPIPQGGMAAVLSDTWPVVVKAAAVASAAFVLWRARRPG